MKIDQPVIGGPGDIHPFDAHELATDPELPAPPSEGAPRHVQGNIRRMLGM